MNDVCRFSCVKEGDISHKDVRFAQELLAL